MLPLEVSAACYILRREGLHNVMQFPIYLSSLSNTVFSSVGEALCYQLSRHGALLIMTDKTKRKMEEIRQSLQYPDNAKYVFTISIIFWVYNLVPNNIWIYLLHIIHVNFKATVYMAGKLGDQSMAIGRQNALILVAINLGITAKECHSMYHMHTLVVFFLTVSKQNHHFAKFIPPPAIQYSNLITPQKTDIKDTH